MKRAVSRLYRFRIPVTYVAAVLLTGSIVLRPFLAQSEMRRFSVYVTLGAALLAAFCFLISYLFSRGLPTPAIRVVQPPIEGRWLALNSPASKVPSHGVRAYGQAYAIDLVHEPFDSTRPTFGGQTMRASQEYPAFGQPVFAMIEGTVVKASDWRRDHRTRSNWPGFFYFLIEGTVRELGGPGFIIGNHVTIRSDDGIYATVAHLKQGSVEVNIGDRVFAGSRIGKCGNSGNSTEPHVHAQLMDRQSPWIAQGIPMAFRNVRLGDDPTPVDGLPANEQHITARPTAHTNSRQA